VVVLRATHHLGDTEAAFEQLADRLYFLGTDRLKRTCVGISVAGPSLIVLCLVFIFVFVVEFILNVIIVSDVLVIIDRFVNVGESGIGCFREAGATQDAGDPLVQFGVVLAAGEGLLEGGDSLQTGVLELGIVDYVPLPGIGQRPR